MKQFKLTLALGLLLIIGATSCNKVNGPIVSQSFSISGFNKINLANDANLTYIADSQFSIEVQAQQKIIDRLKINLEGTTLNVDDKAGFVNLIHEPINIIVKAPSFAGATVSGSGDVKVNSFFKSNSLDLEVSGSGSILLNNMETVDVTAEVTGSGSIKYLTGKANTTANIVSGSGSINMQEIPSVTATANVSGSGEIKVNVSSFLKAKISGSGDIFLKGNPTIEKTISGSGSIIQL